MKKILVIEDEQAYLDLLKQQLTDNGYEVSVATNGKDGLAKAKSELPDLVLLDIRLPQMDGMSVLDALRASEEGKNLKVILLTNLEPDDQMMEGVLKTQPAYYFVKSDIKIDDLLNKIKTLLAN